MADRFIAYAVVLAAVSVAFAGLAWAVPCAGGPRWLGINAQGVMEYCGTDGQVHQLAFGDLSGSASFVSPTPQPTFAYVAPTPQPAAVAPTPQPTFAYLVPTPAPAPTRVPALTAVYDPASLAANTTRSDTIAVTGIVTGRAVVASPGVAPATGCVIAAVRASATDQVTVTWRNAFASTTACDTASSTWAFVQP